MIFFFFEKILFMKSHKIHIVLVKYSIGPDFIIIKKQET